MNFRPLLDRVIVKKIKPERETASGIVVPLLDKTNQGEVLAVGPGAPNKKGEIQPVGVKVGDRVIFAKHGGLALEIGLDEVWVMRAQDIHGVLE